jgi:hypothetical protein
LKVTFPELVSIAHCKEEWVADRMQFFIRDLLLDISFIIKPVQVWEVDLVASFFDLLFSQIETRW